MRILQAVNEEIDIQIYRSINICNRVYSKAVSHFMQDPHLAGRVEISKFVSSDGFFIFLLPESSIIVFCKNLLVENPVMRSVAPAAPCNIGTGSGADHRGLSRRTSPDAPRRGRRPSSGVARRTGPARRVRQLRMPRLPQLRGGAVADPPAVR